MAMEYETEPAEMDEEASTIASGAMWQNASMILFKLVSFLYTILIARLVAQEEVGLFYFGLGLVGLAAMFSDFGLTTAAQRYIPYYLGKKDKESAARVVKTTLFLGTALLISASAILFLLAQPLSAFFGNPKLAPIMVLFSAQLAISQLFGIASSLLVSFKMVRESSLASTAQNTLKLLLTVAFIFLLGANASSLTMAFAFSFALSAIYLFHKLQGAVKEAALDLSISLRSCLPLLHELLPFGIAMVGVLLFWNIIGYTDRVMIGYYLQGAADAQIAIYSIATSFAGLIMAFSSSILGIFFPVISELVGKNDFAKVRKTSQTALRWILFSSLPVLAFLLAFSAPILHLLYGESYEPGYIVLCLFSLGLFISLLGAVQRTVLAGMRLVKIELFSVATGAIVNIILNVLLVPPFGINGSALASLFAFITMTAINHYFAAQRFGFHFPPGAWKNMAAGFAAFLLLLVIASYSTSLLSMLPTANDSSIATLLLEKIVRTAALGTFFALGGLAYLLCLNLMHLFESEDAAVLHSLFKKLRLPKSISQPAMKLIFFNQPKILQKGS